MSFISALQLLPLSIYQPYFDLPSVSILYSSWAGGYLFDNSNSGDNIATEVAKYSWLNHNNPDWQTLLDGGSTIVLPDVNGESFFSLNNVSQIVVDILSYPPNQDFWWGSNQFSKFGIVAFMSGGVIQGNFRFVNGLHQGFGQSVTYSDGVYLNMQPGVHAQVSLTAALVTPPSTFFQTSGPPVQAPYPTSINKFTLT